MPIYYLKTEHSVMLLHIIYLVAIVAEAMSGAIMGMRRGMDFFGICVVGTVTALGGGSIRDMLLGHYPLGWVANPKYLLFTITAAALLPLIIRHLHYLRLVFLTVDGLGLVAFTIIGYDIAIASGTSPTIAVMAGMITGVFGGLLRDVLCNEIPLVLQRELYASVSLATGAFYMGLNYLNIPSEIATTVALLSGFSLRLLAVWFHWKLPSFKVENVRFFE
jgi:uncharacterized membrane protein YeiH